MKNNRLLTSTVLVAILLICYVWNMHNTAYDNAASRLDLAFSLALSGDLNIDEYHTNTIDKAFYNGHYYCDKAPGVSLPAAGVVAVLARVFPDADWHPDNPVAQWPLILLIIALPSVLSLLLFCKVAEQLSGGDALFPAVIYAAGTLAMPYSGLFYSHQPAAALLMAAFFIWFSEAAGNMRRTPLTGFLTGVLAGYAIVCEYPAAVPAAIIIAISFYDSRSLRHRAALLAGAAAALAVLAGYNAAAFGHPLHIGYQYEVQQWFKVEMGRGIGGVTFPDPKVFFKLLFQPQRGLFWAQPFLLLALPGMSAAWKSGALKRRAAVACGLIFLSGLVINSAYYEPYGGFAPGPRFLVHVLPFAALLAAAGWNNLDGYARGTAAGAGVFSIIYYFIINLVEPHVPHIFNAPLFQFTMPLLVGGYKLRTIGNYISGAGSLAAVPAVLLACLVVWSLMRGMKNENLNESLLGIITGFMAVAVLFMVSSVHLGTDTSKTSYYKGAAFMSNGQYEEAADYFLDAVNEEPGFRQAWYRLGIARIRLQNYNDAIYCFEESLLLDPGDTQARISLAATWLTVGNVARAVPIIHNGLLRQPGNTTLLELKKTAEEMSGRK